MIRHKLHQIINMSTIDEIEKVDGYCVKEAVYELKPGKLDISESFVSDAF